MDELWVRQKARGFVAKVTLPPVFGDLTPYLDAINAKLRHDELGQGESGYTITKPNGRHIVTVNSTETLERQRFTICHEIAHIVLELPPVTKRCLLGLMPSGTPMRWPAIPSHQSF